MPDADSEETAEQAPERQTGGERRSRLCRVAKPIWARPPPARGRACHSPQPRNANRPPPLRPSRSRRRRAKARQNRRGRSAAPKLRPRRDRRTSRRRPRCPLPPRRPASLVASLEAPLPPTRPAELGRLPDVITRGALRGRSLARPSADTAPRANHARLCGAAAKKSPRLCRRRARRCRPCAPPRWQGRGTPRRQGRRRANGAGARRPRRAQGAGGADAGNTRPAADQRRRRARRCAPPPNSTSSPAMKPPRASPPASTTQATLAERHRLQQESGLKPVRLTVAFTSLKAGTLAPSPYG